MVCIPRVTICDYGVYTQSDYGPIVTMECIPIVTIERVYTHSDYRESVYP